MSVSHGSYTIPICKDCGTITCCTLKGTVQLLCNVFSYNCISQSTALLRLKELSPTWITIKKLRNRLTVCAFETITKLRLVRIFQVTLKSAKTCGFAWQSKENRVWNIWKFWFRILVPQFWWIWRCHCHWRDFFLVNCNQLDSCKRDYA